MDKRFLLIIAALVVIFGGIFWFTKSNSSNNTGSTGENSSQTSGSNNVIGNNTTGVELVEFADYQCPACYQFHPIVEQIVEEYGDRISFQFRNFPLVQIHPNAMIAARAAEAAGMQGKFWEMNDLLFTNQQNWSSVSNPTSIFVHYAEQLGLDTAKFQEDMSSSATLAIINADVSAAQALGATGTPTFVLNGKKIDTPNSYEAFAKLLDDAIAENQNNQ